MPTVNVTDQDVFRNKNRAAFVKDWFPLYLNVTKITDELVPAVEKPLVLLNLRGYSGRNVTNQSIDLMTTDKIW